MQSSTRDQKNEESASGRLAYAQRAQVGETERVSQREHSTSTGHGPKLVRRARVMRYASPILTADFDEEYAALMPRKSAEIHVLGLDIIFDAW